MPPPDAPDPSPHFPLLGAAPEGGGPPILAQIPLSFFPLAGLRPDEVPPVLWEAACEVAAELHLSRGVDQLVAFDPMTILAIIGLIIQIVKFYRECRAKPAEAAASWRTGPLMPARRLRRWKLRKIVAAHMDDPDLVALFGGDFEPVVDAVESQAARLAEMNGDAWAGRLFAAVPE